MWALGRIRCPKNNHTWGYPTYIWVDGFIATLLPDIVAGGRLTKKERNRSSGQIMVTGGQGGIK